MPNKYNTEERKIAHQIYNLRKKQRYHEDIYHILEGKIFNLNEKINGKYIKPKKK